MPLDEHTQALLGQIERNIDEVESFIHMYKEGQVTLHEFLECLSGLNNQSQGLYAVWTQRIPPVEEDHS